MTLAVWGEVNQSASSVYTGVVRLAMVVSHPEGNLIPIAPIGPVATQ